MVLIVALCLNTVVLQLLLSTVVSSAEEARRTAVALADSNWELQASQAALQQLHSELEERVGLRTTELSQANLELQRQISERQRTEAALNESELRFNAIFNHTLGFTAIMSPDGTLIDVNQAPLEAGGFNREEVLGRPFWETGWWRGLPEEQSTLKASIVEAASGQPVRGETVYLAANGTRRFAERVLHPIKDDDGHVKFLIAEGLDITERKRAEEALRQAQKTESLGVLAGGVAHDFNNLLVAILGQTSLAQAILPEENRAYAHIEKAAKAAKRAADLTRQLLAYSGRGQFEARPLNLNVLIQENLHLFEVAIPKHIHLRSQLAQPLPLIEADTGQMQQIIMNLILNAVEAIGDQRGTIMVGTGIHRITDEDRSYGQSGGEPLAVGSYVTLEITDNGIGMDASTLTRIFDPFFTTKPTGRGLGLAAVLGIVRGHKGELQVHSQVGNGTTFKVLLPALALNMTPAVLATANEVGRRGSQGLILVIDDEAPVREAVADILGLEGITVLTAANGATGIELYRQSMDDVKLVILDLSLPGLSGAEIFRELRRMDPAVKVLLSSGYDQVEATRHFIGQGLAGFLQKPYESEGLVEKVRSYL
jgi:PAS domain S-box-containing protein